MSVDGSDADVVAGLPWHAPLPWQGASLRQLLEERAQFPHAVLIHGRPGIGKLAFALNLGLGLLCEAPAAADRPCGACPSCRYAQAGQHPDLLRIELVVPDDEGGWKRVENIAIDRIRGLIDFVQLSSHRRIAKVVVICPAERMQAPAANALLKTLEEPPPATYLLLVTDQPGRLPPTILSRCRRFAGPQPSPDEALAWLAAQGVDDPALPLAQAGGAPLRALEVAADLPAAERRHWLEALAEPARTSALALGARIDALPKELRKQGLALAIEWLLGWCSDVARVAAGGEVRRNPDFAPAIAALAVRVAPLSLFRYHRTLVRQRALLAHPLQPRLVAEALVADYKELFG
jgi:DNA polymerase-3 subunit delta'